MTTLPKRSQTDVSRLRSSAPARALIVLGAVSLTGLASCGRNPFELLWSEAPDTVLLYSLARPELNLPSAFNFNDRVSIRVEAPTASGRWDLAVDTEDGDFFFLPPGALGIESRAGITKIGVADFPEVSRAPSDTTVYSVDMPLRAELGNVYVVRTGESRGSFGRRCVYFAKLEPIEIDVAEGTIQILFDNNPVCNDVRLIPPN